MATEIKTSPPLRGECYLVSYDLASASREDYQMMEDLMLQWGGKKLLQSQWAVRLDHTSSEEIVHRIINGQTKLLFTGNDDRLLVTPLDIANSDGWQLITDLEFL